ncbi:hypothetical protein [Bosea sp. (in: a-proteobacteria)]|uniref:hypothetical protein n=1 Tax=Bosea sp. (in: a-proteobacteria) TaxID=1871050 RepID=UPI0025BD1654|nr:hypothetical protein [Bosea sp. (in: a-proteobacteria)]MBR3190172.1 hypothetical protein [Bosea sp. (in: a-proteobacteria)]
MGQVLQFRQLKPQLAASDGDALDLMSAIDFALRDLADITPHILHEPSRERARQCRQMLQDAFEAALQAG